MKIFLDIDKISLVLEQFFKATTKLKYELLTGIGMETVILLERLSLAEGFHVKKWEASENTDLDKQEISRIHKTLQSIQCELVNNTSKLTEIDEPIKIQKKFEDDKNKDSYIKIQ